LNREWSCLGHHVFYWRSSHEPPKWFKWALVRNAFPTSSLVCHWLLISDRKDSAVRVSLSFYLIFKQPHPKMSNNVSQQNILAWLASDFFSARRYWKRFTGPPPCRQRRRVWVSYRGAPFGLSTRILHFFCKRFT
jgi:hypothetical protein